VRIHLQPRVAGLGPNLVARNAVFQTFEKELNGAGANALKPLERLEVSDGMAMPDEVARIVANRSGVMLSASTILKSDFFSNLQKMSLPEYVYATPYPNSCMCSSRFPPSSLTNPHRTCLSFLRSTNYGETL
jgi:hypothetical protein